MAKKKARITDEVQERLDDIFGEMDGTTGEGEKSLKREKSALRDLKSVILSIEWEISDDVMNGFLEEVNKLKNVYDGDRIMTPFFKMLASLGRYISKYKAKANPGAIKILNSVFGALEKILSTDALNEMEKEDILLGEVQRFKALKKEILQHKTSGRERVRAKKMPSDLADGKGALIDWEEGQGIPESILAKLNELKVFIQSEFKTLREEIQTLLDEKKKPKCESDRTGKK